MDNSGRALTERGLSFEAAERLHGEAVLAV
jgi:hypothetical protein